MSRPRIFQPLGDGFWPDVKGALGFLVGAGIAVLLFDNLTVLLASAVGVTIVVIASPVGRARRSGEPGPRA